MPSKWEVISAVKWSNLPPSWRLVMLWLLDASDVDTATTSREHTPSLTTLRQWTGLAKSTVAEVLNGLEVHGWVKRDRPSVEAARSKRARTTYILLIGVNVEEKPKKEKTPEVVRPPDLSTSPLTGLVRSPDHSTSPATGPLNRSDQRTSPATGPVRSAHRTTTSPATGPEVVRPPDCNQTTHLTNQDPFADRLSATAEEVLDGEVIEETDGASGNATGTGAEEAPAENGGTITKAWIDYCTDNGVKIPKQLIGHYAKVIKTALDDGFTPLQVKTVLAGMLTDRVANHPSWLPNRLMAAQIGPERRAPREAAVDSTQAQFAALAAKLREEGKA